jgi:hypothetical protein
MDLTSYLNPTNTRLVPLSLICRKGIGRVSEFLDQAQNHEKMDKSKRAGLQKGCKITHGTHLVVAAGQYL